MKRGGVEASPGRANSISGGSSRRGTVINAVFAVESEGFYGARDSLGSNCWSVLCYVCVGFRV